MDLNPSLGIPPNAPALCSWQWAAPLPGRAFPQLPLECGVDESGSYWGRGIVMGLVGVRGGGA